MTSVQGDQEEIRKAQKMLDEVNAAFSEAESRKEEATAALRAARQRGEELRAAKAELQAALDELKVPRRQLCGMSIHFSNVLLFTDSFPCRPKRMLTITGLRN